MAQKDKIVIIGGGAAGFFTAINLAAQIPSSDITILERGKEVLSKVRISGGGRCNVTHAEFVPKELSVKYPRGEKELLGPFHTFMTGDTIAWFQERGVELKIEEDGRMFPWSDSSQTIIDCFLNETKRLGVTILKQCTVQELAFAKAQYTLKTTKGDIHASQVVVASGSSPKMWKQLEKLGHTIVPAVPSLFTFNIKDKRIQGLMGLSTEASLEVVGTKLKSEGPLLITHWGMSGPSVLKLSAWGARDLNKLNYDFKIKVNWLLDAHKEDARDTLQELKHKLAKQSPHTYTQFDLPKRLWQSLLLASGIQEKERWADLNKKQIELMAMELTEGVFSVKGKSTFKEEFVTAGGVNLKEIDFKTFESKLLSNLYLAGEVLNIDAITGGFNFQNAWTGGYHIAQAIASKMK